MRKAVRAIVVKDNKLLTMHRNKFGQEYFTLIGGKIDVGETQEQALHREIKEETGLTVREPKLVLIEEAGDPFGTQYIYHCKYVHGEVALNPKSIEAEIHAMGQNLYVPKWIDIKELPKLPFRSETLKETLLHFLKNGFPDKPQTIHPTHDIRYNKSSN